MRRHARARSCCVVFVSCFSHSGLLLPCTEVRQRLALEQFSALRDERAHEQMLRAAGVGQTERKRQLSKVRSPSAHFFSFLRVCCSATNRVAAPASASFCACSSCRRHFVFTCTETFNPPSLPICNVQSVVTEAFPESEFNVRGADGDGAGGSLTIHEMLESLGSGGAALGLKKRLSKLDKATAKPLSVPLAPAIQQRMERLAAYDATKEDITRWQPLVKANRELATLSFPSRRDNIPRKTSVQAVLSDFRPESELEMEVDALLAAAGVAGSTRQVEKVEALAMNTLDVEQVKERQARLSKMRALLFYHDEKAKRLKSIKSKSYRKHEASRLKMLAKKKGLTDAARLNTPHDPPGPPFHRLSCVPHISPSEGPSRRPSPAGPR